jgi:hypothetical protein
VYDIVDSLKKDYGEVSSIGGWADGFFGVSHDYLVYDGCRAWHCSDDGFNIAGGWAGLKIIMNCWAFNNANLQGTLNVNGETIVGEGNGWKINPDRENPNGDMSYILINNIAAFNMTKDGFSENNKGDYEHRLMMYNNTSYNNEIGFHTYDGGDGVPVLENDYRNNIAYNNWADDIVHGGSSNFNPDIYNSWNPATGVTVTDEDFVLIDSAMGMAQLLEDRKSDGSLPDITFKVCFNIGSLTSIDGIIFFILASILPSYPTLLSNFLYNIDEYC